MNWNLHDIAGDARWRKLNAVLPALTTGGLVALSAWTAAGLTWQVVGLATTEPALPPASFVAADSASSADSGVDLNEIARLHLFGKADAGDQPLESASIDAPETRLNIQLLGILAGDEQSPSLAIIRSGQDERVYSKGDTVARGASVHAILADRVILRRSGQLETLRLPKLGADIKGIEVADMSRVEPDTLQRELDPAELRDKIAQNPAALSELLRYSPVMRDGELAGYRLYPGRDRASFTNAGLRPGDIVTEINGTSLSDPAQAISMMNSLKETDSITLTIERGGEQMSLSLNMTQ